MVVNRPKIYFKRAKKSILNHSHAKGYRVGLSLNDFLKLKSYRRKSKKKSKIKNLNDQTDSGKNLDIYIQNFLKKRTKIEISESDD
ncbi:hypothetical protein BpHYR1_010895 [Brachionus plicatilis]|uniref:Uncharacterized protein n=1 Tax=Brachionus plicatilis TaxID=10195 RepID=A0A3M7QWN0_BRAPC|nr:hypothetical protein BpHYR1_010895 [Brachionus plicatilis]